MAHTHNVFRGCRVWPLFAILVAPAASAAQTPPATAAPTSQTPTSNAQVVALTMDQAVKMGLESNLGLEASRMNLENASYGVAAARSAFLPVVGTSLSKSSSKTVPSDFTQGADDITSQGLVAGSSYNQLLPFFGTRYDLSLSNTRSTQAGGRPRFNPGLRSTFAFNVTQPLWRGLRIDANRAALDSSHRRQTIVTLQLQQEQVRLETRIRQSYLDLLSAREGLNVAKQNMELRQRSLENARARVTVGASAQIELISAEADVASNQEQVLLAEAQIATREDALRTLIFDPTRSDYWQVRLAPIDTIRSDPPHVDLDAAITRALGDRLDLAVARRNLELSDLNLKVSRNSTRPAVDLRVSYSSSGTGGTRLTYDEDVYPPVILSRADRSLGSVFGDTFGFLYPAWSAAVNVSYVVGRSAAEANRAQQEVARRQDAIQLRELEIAIVQQVRDAARQVENSYQRVLVTRAALRASALQLDAEQRRFDTGLSTTFELQGRQGQLASARTAELNAVISHQRALIEFERIQRSQ
jgi:outer membrane protein TolC